MDIRKTAKALKKPSNAETAFLIPETNFSVEESRRNLFEFDSDVRGVSSLNETKPEAELMLNQSN